ncbi:MAG: (d)CMP kinase [bacterium]
MTSLQEVPVVTLDGPGGAGKGTIAGLLARRLEWHILDSGALYRILALAAMKKEVLLDDVPALTNLARTLPAEFSQDAQGVTHVLLDGADVTTELRTEACGNAASQVASICEVRDALLQRQRDFRQPPGLVADGRDMGTVVFPEAKVKIYLTASLEERAKRRYKQLKEKGVEISIDALFREIAERDERDCNRKVSPLKPADDAIQIDCSDMSIDQVLDSVVGIVEKVYAAD